ncbi:MAG: adenylate kinase [Dysgonamonadaceae bacterium]|nr:adenylate kinase [Dysgonamonadaceae bacterium]
MGNNIKIKPENKFNVVIFGAPGSGKGTQSELIIEKYGLLHISTGEILREEIKKESELGKEAEEYITKGHLCPDELVLKIIDGVLDENPDVKGFIFDGFPRTLEQGKSLDEMLRKKESSIIAVINLDVDEKQLIERLIKRGKETGRADDNPQTIEKRLAVYHEQTEPLLEYYKKKGKLFNIKGQNDIEEVFDCIAETLDRLTFQNN